MTDEGDMDDSITIPSQANLSKFEDPALQKGLMAGPEDPNFSRGYVNYHHWLAAQEAKGVEHMAKPQVSRAIRAHALYPGDSLGRLQHGHFQTERG
jgi:hypothetical protein